MASVSYRSIGRSLHRLQLNRTLNTRNYRQYGVNNLRPCRSTSTNVNIVQSGKYLSASSVSSVSAFHRHNLTISGAKLFHSSPVSYDEATVIVETPPFAESVTEGDIRWDKSVGDTVAEDEVVGEIETDKTSIPVTAPTSGVIEELFVADGDKVEKGTQLFKLRVAGAASTTTKPAEPAEPAKPSQETPKESAPPPLPSTPSQIPTTPPPVPSIPRAPIAEVTPGRPTPLPSTPIMAAPDIGTQGTRSEHKVKMSRMRQRISQRLKDSQNTYAMLTTFNEVDMSNAMDMRQKHKDAFMKTHGLKLGFMSTFVKAACHALQSEPIVNAVIEGNEILYRDYVDISVAVATPKGLVVPVIRNVETMNYADIEKTIHGLGEKARTNELAIEDMDGGTFTISNGGVFGSMMGTPIINPPQSAILGMHAINERPVAINGKVEIRPMMYLALTYDHRLIDGREAVIFLRKIKAVVEDPRCLLLDL